MRLIFAVIVLGLSLLTSGCWDRIEIQDRAIVKAMGIDLAESPIKPGETFVSGHGAKKYTVAFQILKVTGSSGKGSKGEAGTYVIVNTGESLFEILRDAMGQTSKPLNFEHLDSVIISEAAIRESGLRPLIDLFTREPEFRWRIKLFITSGKARPILEFQPPTGEPGGQYISLIANNHFRDPHLPIARTDLGYITGALDNEADVMMPRLEFNDGVLKMGGGALFQNDKFVEYIDDYTVKGIRLLRGLQKSAAIVAPCPDHPDKIVVLKMTRAKTHIHPGYDDAGLYYIFTADLEGDVEEFMCDCQSNIDSKMIPLLEEVFAREVENNIYHSINRIQMLKLDPTGYLTREIRSHLPDYWKKIKPDWRDVFAAARFNVSVKVRIRNMGDHR